MQHHRALRCAVDQVAAGGVVGAAVHGIWTFAQTGSDVSGTTTTATTSTDGERKGDKLTR